MRLFEYFDRYLIDKDYKITILDGKIHIINYEQIEDFSNNKIIVRHNKGKTIFLGTDLVVTRMQDEELIITGKLKTIEYK